jgi:hypothetical protein
VTNSAELTCKGDGNRNILHSEGINASCEKSHVNMSGTLFVDSVVELPLIRKNFSNLCFFMRSLVC